MGRGRFEHRYRGRSLADPADGGEAGAPTLVHAVEKDGAPLSVDLWCADNLDLLRLLGDRWAGKLDLVYLDPPFGTGRRFRARVAGGKGKTAREVDAYSDDRAFEEYLDWLDERFVAARETLSPTGSLYVHLDWHAVHHAKVRLDRIFGRERFLNEIVWCYHGPNPGVRSFKRKHDTILVYTRGPSWFFDADAVRVPYDESTVRTFRSSARAGFGKTPNLARGKVPEDWWYFPVVARLHGERVGYETQKPLALLDRIVRASSPPGGTVADFFCGSGTTGVAALAAGRSALLCDSSRLAIGKALDRLEQLPAEASIRVWSLDGPKASKGERSP